jgi:hypothetical protein
MSAERRKLLDHVGNFAHVIRFALADLDDEQFEKFLSFVIDQIAEVKAERLDEAWRLE